jgi:NAD(P)-dependent dehydrogenase (short-subunit alcohol dehydrogenase family)
MGKLNNQIAIITGGNSGIGKATAELFAQEGATVVIVARRENKNKEVVDAINAKGGKAIAIQGDVTNPDTCKAVVDQVAEKFGKIDILVNDAGGADFNRSAKNVTNEFWDEMVALNQSSVFYMSREVTRYMEPAGSGNIVNVSSIGGVFSCAGVAYSAAKHAVIGITRNMAIQYAGRGIRINAICPGPTNTPLFSPEFADLQDKEFARITAKHVRLGLEPSEPIDQAKAILFFASDDSSAVTGQYLVIDKGMCL